ncbi:MAG: 1,4-alpha-glucan branching protein GlgB [Gammaproteobacteria bacterium]|nr:1,4-alpha-glucan branching protein GlgB [Gammaproteobacteria bacterium]
MKQEIGKNMRLNDDLQRIIHAKHHDPLAVLGRHQEGSETVITLFRPLIREISVESSEGAALPFTRIEGTDFFQWRGNGALIPRQYRLTWVNDHGERLSGYDPYAFPIQIKEFDLHLFGEGRHYHSYRFLGAHLKNIDGVEGVHFATWAPNAERVSVVGDFNGWDGRIHPLQSRGGGGIWELFIPGIAIGSLYKFELRNRNSGAVAVKIDPYGRQFEQRPLTSSRINDPYSYHWNDGAWMEQRRHFQLQNEPISVYELHLGSWQLDPDHHFLNYREIGERLVAYMKKMHFTHIELLPITEHPLDLSWGYQTTGYFAASSRFGTPDDLRYLIDLCHQNDIGVLLDWVPAHFPKDEFALARFDGSALYEHEDPRKGEHRDWGTLIFNYGRNEVRNFLISSAIYWLEEFHIDGLRVDAVASMLYLDYSREPGDWIPNEHGGNENLEAVAFIRHLNTVVHELFPGILMVAEESTSWPMVSKPVDSGGLGFTMKWNMGWMNDTLHYIQKDPVHRQHHHTDLTFGLLYAFSENFILPFSHDEVVHLKRSMIQKMPGDEWQRYANLRLLYSYMYTMCGKKLLFMGCEFAQSGEWSCNKPLDWWLLDFAPHQGVQRLVSELNQIYRTVPALYQYDFDGNGFQWLDCNDASYSLLSFIRKGREGDHVVVILNFTPVPRKGYRIGLPNGGRYRELFNSDSEYYGGSNIGNALGITAEDKPWMDQSWSALIDLPPLAAVFLTPASGSEK